MNATGRLSLRQHLAVRARFLVLLVAALALAFANTERPAEAEFGGKDIRLDPADDYEAGTFAWGDMDGDGDLDLASEISGIFVNEGHGFRATNQGHGFRTTELPESSHPAWGDYDGDGDLDLAFGYTILRNDGASFSEAFVIPRTDDWDFDSDEFRGAPRPVWADWDGDGDLDFAIDGRVYPNHNEQIVQSPAINVGSGNMAWGDRDGDGDLDLAFGGETKTQVYDNHEGALTAVWEYPRQSTDVAWTDFDGDGDLDLAAALKAQHGDRGQLSVFANDAGDLSSGYEHLTGPASMAWADAEADGSDDMAALSLVWEEATDTGYGELWVQYFEDGQEADSWGDGRPYIGHNSDAQAAWGDSDNDGDLDLAAPPLDTIYINQLISSLFRPGGGWYKSPYVPFLDNYTYGAGLDFADWNGDGDLELAVATRMGVEIWQFDGATMQLVWQEETFPYASARSDVAWGDYDADGDPDLAGDGTIFRNDGGSLHVAAELEGVGETAWVDIDGDGDLDLALGLTVFTNDAGVFNGQAIAGQGGYNIAWGDWDNDGDPDPARGTDLFENQNGVIVWRMNAGDASARAFAGDQQPHNCTEAHDANVDWGDWDGDGDLDLAVNGEFVTVYRNDGQSFALAWSWPAYQLGDDISWIDLDQDRDLDLVSYSSYDQTIIFRNDDGVLTHDAQIGYDYDDEFMECDETQEIAWADWDLDGDLDVAQTAYNHWGEIFEWRTRFYLEATLNERVLGPADALRVEVAAPTGYGHLWTQAIVPIHYTLIHPDARLVGRVQVSYSLNGGGQWRSATPIETTKTTHLTASPTGVAHVFLWDMVADGVFGLYDDVLIRIDAYTVPSSTAAQGTYRYPHQTHQSFVQAPRATDMTPSFRVRGSQVRVLDASGQPVSGAVVYRQPVGQTQAQPIADNQGRAFTTNDSGYLQGHGELRPGDRLVALLPVEQPADGYYTLYHTSAPTTATGLRMHTVEGAGTQTLTVEAGNPLFLFNLVMSLEWDARRDTTFMDQLENDIGRASQILYDLTDGQTAIGQVDIYHDKGHWGIANVVIPASNSIRPAATLGGIVREPADDVDRHGRTIEDAFVPGQVRIGPTWNRFGEAAGTLGEDWPRTLAHELGHYLFYVPDNYLGLTPQDELTLINCRGSVMSDPYRDEYSEFLRRADWTGDCLNTLAERYLGRADWQTIARFYPALAATLGRAPNPGPANMPLDVTHVAFLAPPGGSTTLTAPFFHLENNAGQPLAIPAGRSQAYLLKTRRDATGPEAAYVVDLGTAVGDLVQARGAQPGDRLCVFDFSAAPTRLGCQTVAANPGSVRLQELPGWAPVITVTGISTDTVRVDVAGAGGEHELAAQLLPALGAASPELPMARHGDTWRATLTATDGAFYGHVRIRVPGANPAREMIVAYTNLEAWRGYAYAWGGYAYAWGSPPDAWGGYAYAWGGYAYAWGGYAYAWGAPVMSGDGQVMVMPLDSLFGRGRMLTLQSVPQPPALNSWLTQVGQAYRLATTGGDVPRSAIIFRYLARDVPDGQEANLSLYYSADEGQTWERLDTHLDAYYNHASTSVRGPGLYVLAATVELPGFAEGWNQFGYPLAGARPVAEALASIAGQYTSVAHYDTSGGRWLLYDTTVGGAYAGLVNTLVELRFSRLYWLYATEDTTLFLPVAARVVPATTAAEEPPSTFYGPALDGEGLIPTAGMVVEARVGGELCGQSTLVPWAGSLAYVIQVRGNGACGRAGRTVSFMIDGRPLAHSDRLWDNSRAHYHPLSSDAPPDGVLLPFVTR